MNLGDRLAKLNHLQRTTKFKIAASILVVATAIVAFAVWWTALNAPQSDIAVAPPAAAERDMPARTDDAPSTPNRAEGDEVVAEQNAADDFKPRLDPSAVLNAVGSRDATLGVGVGTAVVTGVILLIIWLGAGLTYLALAALTAALLIPLRLLPGTSELSAILAGVAVLAGCFTIFVEAVRVALTGAHPVFAIARTVVSEAVRMKISLVFILILIGWLASLPWLLDDAQPLRYRVQTFLRNGSAGAFWALALLTMFFSVATLSFEQRDKIVWATVVKPVRSWHYIVGKWLGVMAVNAALLAVAGSGVFLFTEYLRSQPAVGEVEPYINASGSAQPTTDRLILEARVLTARDVREPILPEISQEAIDAEVTRLVDNAIRTEGDNTPEARARNDAVLRPTVLKRAEAARTTVEPFGYREYLFPNLTAAKELGRPVTLRYKVQAGANDPTVIFAMLFEFIDNETGQTVPLSIDSPLNIAQSIDLKPNVISDAGELRMRVYNGDPLRGQANRLTMRFPPDGLEVYYVRGGYEMNFLRIVVALLLKLGFICAAGVFAATFLSFPVAALFSFLVLFAAETSGFLAGALGIYSAVGHEGDVQLHRVAIRIIAYPIAYVFGGYRALDSTHRLVDGELLGWDELIAAGLAILALTGGLLGASVLIFRKRELATYSGH